MNETLHYSVHSNKQNIHIPLLMINIVYTGWSSLVTSARHEQTQIHISPLQTDKNRIQ